MRQILLAVVVVVPQVAFAQSVTILPNSVIAKQDREEVMVVAQEAELREQDHVVGTISRSHHLGVEKNEADGFQVRWKGKVVWISRADALPLDDAMEYFAEVLRQKPTAIDYVARGILRTEAET